MIASLRSREALVVLAPFVWLLVHWHAGHQGDLAFFFDWLGAFREGADFYAHGPGLNYPIVGVLLVCLPARLFEIVTGTLLDLEGFIAVHKVTLAIGESLFLWSAALLAQDLEAKHPWRVALLVYAMPSSWAMGAYFGQIDVFGSALQLLALHLVLHPRIAQSPSVYGASCVAMFFVILLTKQLAWLGLLPLMLAFVLRVKVQKERVHIARGALFALALSLLGMLAIDALVAWPFGIASHLLFVLNAPGSAHLDLAVANGASFWSLLVQGGTPASTGLFGLDWLTIGRVGKALFVVFTVLTLWLQSRDARGTQTLSALGTIALLGAFILPGSHERYLVHALPPLLLVAFTQPRSLAAVMTCIVSLLSGHYVLASIHWEAFDRLRFLRDPPLLVLAQALLLGALFAAMLRPHVTRTAPSLGRDLVR